MAQVGRASLDPGSWPHVWHAAHSLKPVSLQDLGAVGAPHTQSVDLGNDASIADCNSANIARQRHVFDQFWLMFMVTCMIQYTFQGIDVREAASAWTRVRPKTYWKCLLFFPELVANYRTLLF